MRRKGEEIARLGEGDIFGESAIVNHALRSASIVTLDQARADPLQPRAGQPAPRGDPGLRPRPGPGGAGSPRRLLTSHEDAAVGEDVPLDDIERFLLGARPTLTRVEVADQAGVPLELAEELWGQLGFARTADDDVAFTTHDVDALRRTAELVSLGILGSSSQAALVRTWGRSYARLAEWQAELLAGLALADDDPEQAIVDLVHGGDAAGRGAAGLRLASPPRERRAAAAPGRRGQRRGEPRCRWPSPTSSATPAAARTSPRPSWSTWSRSFEDETTRVVVAVGGRVIKTIGDEVLYVADDPAAAVEVALALTARGEDDDDPFPRVRAGVGLRGGRPAGSVTSSARPSTSPPGSRPWPGPARCWSTAARSRR